jgi:REP element-mobilizing transposase RayT
MPNHVHLILTPSDKDGLRAALSRVHRMYAGMSMPANNAPAISGKAGSASRPRSGPNGIR